MTKEIFVLGLDVSMNSTGWAVLGVKGQAVRLVDSGIIKANQKQPHGKRLRKQRETFKAIIEKYRPKYVAREAGFSRHIKATQTLFKAYGVADEFFAEDDLVEYAAATIKKVVTGKGRATKEEVESAIRKLLNLPDSFEFQSDDESDAVAIAITLIRDKSLI
ncbi:crossover junction endodeoxyribonuclease RuvC [Bacillus andreraoultii]|uniref:crossover junction endodeoxyribonuclease RuvC n=1 Tax=Bacillus andreraoultii TaxID=1499685 RepID=UPI00053AE11A|nr:crossover junction endodeoxyribonuclease RuvC [Bacillus andreraoultii]